MLALIWEGGRRCIDQREIMKNKSVVRHERREKTAKEKYIYTKPL